MHFNHPQPSPVISVCGKLALYEISPLGAKVTHCWWECKLKVATMENEGSKLTIELPYQVRQRGPDTEKMGMSQGKAVSSVYDWRIPACRNQLTSRSEYHSKRGSLCCQMVTLQLTQETGLLNHNMSASQFVNHVYLDAI